MKAQSSCCIVPLPRFCLAKGNEQLLQAALAEGAQDFSIALV